MKTPDAILRLSALDLFILFLLAGVISEIHIDQLPIFTVIMNIIGKVVMKGWPVLIGHSLYHHFPMLSPKLYRLFTICSVILISTVALLPTVVALTDLSYTDAFILPFVILLWMSGLFCFYFAAKMLQTVKAGGIVDNWDSFMFFILLFFPPLGVWFMQPVIHKAIDNYTSGHTTPEHEY